MECPYLEEKAEVTRCGASTRGRTPDAGEMRIWCSNEEHDNCPMLLSHILMGGSSESLSN